MQPPLAVELRQFAWRPAHRGRGRECSDLGEGPVRTVEAQIVTLEGRASRGKPSSLPPKASLEFDISALLPASTRSSSSQDAAGQSLVTENVPSPAAPPAAGVAGRPQQAGAGAWTPLQLETRATGSPSNRGTAYQFAALPSPSSADPRRVRAGGPMRLRLSVDASGGIARW